jgi:hypothetical protein
MWKTDSDKPCNKLISFSHINLNFSKLRDSQLPKGESEINYWDNNLEDEEEDVESRNGDVDSGRDHVVGPRTKNHQKIPRSASEEDSNLSCRQLCSSSSSSSFPSFPSSLNTNLKINPCAPQAMAEGQVRQVVSSQGCSRVFIVKGALLSPYSCFNVTLSVL